MNNLYIWYMTINGIQIELENGGKVLFLTGVVAHERSKKWKIYGFCLIT